MPDRDSLRGEWGNAIADNEAGFRGIAWSNLFRQHNSCWWWTSWGCDYTPFNPDGTVSLFGQWFFDEARELRAGVGKLLLHAARDDKEVAILYSQADHFAARLREEMLADMPHRLWQRNLADSGELIRQAGLQFRYLDRSQLTDGGLAGVRLLLLPQAVCLSDQQVATIRAFVQKGGVGSRGRTNGPAHRERASSARNGRSTTFSASISKAAPPPSPSLARRRTGARPWSPEPPSQPTASAAAWPCAPTCPSPDSWRGCAWATSTSWPPSWPPPDWCRPAACENHPDAVEQILFRDGGNRYLAFQRDIHQRGENVWQSRVRMAEKSFVHDLRAGVATGDGPMDSPGRSRSPADVPRCIPSFPTAWPVWRPRSPTTRFGARRSPAPSDCGRKASRRATHVVHVAVFPPGSDQEHRQYSRNVACMSGRGEFDIPFALSDPPGSWRVLCRDVATGVATATEVRLR